LFFELELGGEDVAQMVEQSESDTSQNKNKAVFVLDNKDLVFLETRGSLTISRCGPREKRNEKRRVND
jgi:hypothetical protein